MGDITIPMEGLVLDYLKEKKRCLGNCKEANMRAFGKDLAIPEHCVRVPLNIWSLPAKENRSS